MRKQFYKQDEAEQILQEAVRRAAQDEAARATGNGEVPHERLLAMAEELGVSAETLQAVLRDREAELAKEAERAAERQEREQFVQQRRAEFWPHLWSYVGVNLMLIVINLMTGSGHFWAVYPLLGWGIGLFSHAAAALPTGGPAFEKEFASWREKRRRQAAEKERRQQRLHAAPGARIYSAGAPIEIADAVQQVAGAVQQAVGEAARAVDAALRSPGDAARPRPPAPPRPPQRDSGGNDD